jgi:serine-type D-Ala-D-Ala carboxypeptidase/endopeptidase (penicillin-binding protein 4)
VKLIEIYRNSLKLIKKKEKLNYSENKFKWLPYLIGAIAGIWLLALGEGVYFYVGFLKNKSAAEELTNKEAVQNDTIKAIDRLKYYVNELATNDSISHGTFGFCVATADSGKIIYEQNADVSLIPASSLKTITAGVALKLCGAGYVFPTYLQYSGSINSATRTLNGNIYIRGSGDPTLGSNNFGGNTYYGVLQRWLTAIHTLGIDSIHGAIIGDGELFDYDATPGGWAWEDVVNSYGTAPSGLSFRDNCYDVNVSIGGGAVYGSISPEVPGLKTQSSILYNGSIFTSYVYAAGPPFVAERIMRGEVKWGGTYSCPVPDPAYFCAHSLYKYLTKNGIKVSDSSTTVRRQRIAGNNEKPERKALLTNYSPALSSIIYYTLHVSQNMYAETLIKLLSVQKNGYGSTLGGIKVMYDYWDDKNIDMRGFYMTDGCGLSRNNNVSARHMTYMLVSFANDSAIFKTLYNCMPVIGQSLEDSNDSLPIAKYEIHAKGGYMSRVRSFTGYCKNKNGKLLAFTMIANNQEFAWQTLLSRMYRIMKIMTELE